MNTHSASGEVFGTKVLYAAMVIASVVALLAAINNPNASTNQTQVAKAPVTQTTVASNPSSAS